MKSLTTKIYNTLPRDWRNDRLKDLVALRNNKVTVQNNTEDYLELEDIVEYASKNGHQIS